MNRRGFLHGILATAMAPAIVRSESLMKIVVPSQEIILPYQFNFVQVYTNMAKQHALDIETAMIYGTPRIMLVNPRMYSILSKYSK